MPGTKYHAGRYAARYEPYRRSFVVAGFLYLIAFFLGAVLWSRLSLTSFGESLVKATAEKLVFSQTTSFWQSWLSVFLSRLFPQLVLFLLGLTCYAPLVWSGVMLWLGLSGGVGLGFLFRFLSQGMSVWLLPTDLLFSFFSAWIMGAYASFVLCVYRKQIGRIADEDGRMFGGTLFCGKYDKNRINLRFLISYQLLFFAAALMQAAVAVLYRLAMSRIIG